LVADVFTAGGDGAFHGLHTLAAGLQLQPARDLAGCASVAQIVQHAGAQHGLGVHTPSLGALAALTSACVGGGGPVAALAGVAGQLPADDGGVPTDQAGDGAYTFPTCMRERDLLAFSEGEHVPCPHEQPL